MATEEEAREAADGEGVQVEAVDSEPFHRQTHLDSKLSSMEIKNVGEIIDSTEGTLKNPGDPVLAEAPSEIKLPLQHNLNGTASSLNGHMDEENKISSHMIEENKISNEQLHEDSKKDHEQVEAALDGESTEQNNKIKGETTTEDSSLLKHGKEEGPKGHDQQDEDPMPDTLKTDSDIDQSQLVVDQLDHNMDPAKGTEDTQPASMANIPNAEVVTEARAGVQSPLEANLDDSEAILYIVDGTTEKDEATREDRAIHLEHKESFPEDTSTAEHTEEVVKAEDEQYKLADATDADAVQEDKPKCEETGVSEEMPKSENADESIIDVQEELHQGPSEDTNGPDYGKKQTSQQSSMAASDDTASEHDSTNFEPPVDIQVQNKESLEGMKDDEAVDTEAAMQPSCVTFEKVIPESEVTESTEPVETEEDSDQRDVSLLEGSAQEDNTPVSEKHQKGPAFEINGIEATRTEAVPEESNASVSEEPSPEAFVIESGTTCDIKEVNTTESLEAIEGNEDTETREISGHNMDSAGKSTQESNAPESEHTSEIQPEQKPDSEEMETELAQVNESSPEIHATIFHQQTQENNTTTSELHVMESEGGVSNTEATEVQATPYQLNCDSAQEDNTPVSEKHQKGAAFEINGIEATITEAVPKESNASVSEEPSPEDVVIESGTTCDVKEVNTTESLEAIEGNEDTETTEISGQNNMDCVGKSSQESNAPESEPTSEIQPEHEPESEEMEDTELAQVNESSPEMYATVFHKQTQENNPTTSELRDMESGGGVSDIEATEVQAAPHQLNGDSSQEDNTPALEINEIEATRTEAVPEESNASASEEPSPEDYVAESGTTCDIKEVNTTESLEVTEGEKDTKTREISGQNNMDCVGKSSQESHAPESEPTSEIQPEHEPESEEMEDTELTQVSESSPEIYAAVFHKQTQENNPTTSELHVMESEGVSNIEATEVQAAPHQLNSDSAQEEKATEETITSSEPQTLEPESVEKMNDNEATKPQNISLKSISSPSEDSLHEEIAKEDIVTTEPDDCHQQPQDPEIAELDEIEANKSQEIASSSIVSNYEESTSEDKVTVTEPDPETQAENLKSAEVMEDTENVKGHGALAGEAAQEENVETEAIVDISPVQETELEEAKNTEQVGTEDKITLNDLPEKRMEKETVEIEAIPYESPVVSIIEVTENDILTAITPSADIQPVLKQESVEEKCNDTTEKPRETQQVVCSASDELILTEEKTATAEPACEAPLHNVVAQGIKESEDAQTDQFSNLDSFPTPGEAAEESELPRIEPTSDVQEVQELDSTEETRGVEEAKNEDHQKHRVSTLEEPAVENKPNVNDLVHDEKTAELKDNEAMEAEQILGQSNISTPDNAPEERSELGNDPDWCVQPAQQVESSRESEDCELLMEEETSDQKIITLEDTATEDIVADEIDPLVGMEQEHELKTVEEVKDISANHAKEDFHTNQPDASDKLASESNIATTEPTYDIQRLNDIETNEMKSIEGINDGNISCEQTEIATSVDPSPTDDEISPQEHPMESYKENLGNETENAMLAHGNGIKDEIQTTAEQKDDPFDLGETVPTSKKSKNLADEDVTQSSGEDTHTLESSNSTDQTKEGQKAGTEHNTSQKSSECHGENITHVQDKDINEEPFTERGTAESQALIENEAQTSQDVTEKDDTIKSGEQTNVHRQSGDVEHQPQTCESSVEDEAAQKVSLDERYKEDEEVERQKEQLQAGEQRHKDESDISNEPLVESKNTENGTTNRTEETDTLQAGQTEAVINEILKIEQALHTSEDSTASITDTTEEDITGMNEGVEEENRPINDNTSNADAKMDNQEDQENTGNDDIVLMHSTGGQDETTDEITNEELEQGLASSVQEYTAPSKDHILENDPIAVPYNAESGGHKDKECTNEVNDDQLAIQESEKEIMAGMQENKEMQNEAKVIHHAESHTKAEEEEMSQLHSDEPYNVDNKIDDTTDNTTVQLREIEDIGENLGHSSIDKPVVETSEQNNVEQDLSIHHKVEDEKLESTDDNVVSLEATQQNVDTPNVNTNNDEKLSLSNSLKKHEADSADDVLQLETEGNTFDKADETFSYEKTEASNTSVPETVTFNDEICNKVTGAERGLSDESLKTFDDTQRNLDVSTVVTASNEESMNKEMEEHKLAVPAQLTMDENTPKQEISVSEETLPTESEEQENDQICKEQDEEDIHEPDFGDDQKEVGQHLPVSNFLMNLILGKEDSCANGHSEPEAETKQEEIRDEKICLISPKQEESLVLPPTENNVEGKLAVEEEKEEVKCSEETHEVVEEQSNDLKLGTEASLETDVEPNKNYLELPPYQDKMQDEISSEILSEEAAEVFTKMEAEDIAIPNTEQDDREVDAVCQENIESATQNENESLQNSLDDLNNTKTSEEDTLGEVQRGFLPVNDARSVNSVSEQTHLLAESGLTDSKSLISEAQSIQNPVSEIQDKTIESSSIGATSIPNIQVESEEEKQPATIAEVAAEHVEIANDNPQKSIGPEATSDDQESQIAEQGSDTEIALGQEKEISEGSSSTFMDKKEDSDVSVKEANSIQTAVEIQADGSNIQINQDKQEAADNKTAMESEKLEESNIQEQQGNGTQQKSPEECHEEDQQYLVKKETVIKEGNVHETVKSHTETVRIKSNDEQELSHSEVQERDLNVFPPKEVPEPEESSVDKAKPEFSTDEKQQSPKVDELNVLEEKTYEGKTKDEEKIKNFADEAMTTEAQVAGQKEAHKKQNLLSGLKRQLAKVKKVITGKPGHAKPESPKS